MQFNYNKFVVVICYEMWKRIYIYINIYEKIVFALLEFLI